MGTVPIPLPNAAPAGQIPPAGNIVNQGGTVSPVYGVRRPAMYHLMETEMMSISAFNDEAFRWFGIGSFFLTFGISIIINAGFVDGKLSDFGYFMLHRATWFLGLLALACYIFGACAVGRKRGMIKQIKKETKSEG